MSSESDLPEVLFRTRLRRPERNTPWGFRLQGGVEFSKPLTLLKVIPDSIAAKVGLNAGDILVRLAGQSAVSMTHRDAQQAIVNSGNTLEIIVERADVTCPSFSAKVQPEVNALDSETATAEKQNDLQNSGMKIEDTIDENCTSLINNTELIVVVGNDVSETKTEPEVPQNRNTSTTTTTTTASSTPPPPSSVIPTPPTTTDHHPHPHPHHAPPVVVVNDGFTMTPSRTAPPETENSPGNDEERDLPGGKTARTDDDDDLRMEEKLEQEEEEEEEEEKLVASATGIVLPDHNDNNIPLVELELPDSFPVQALIKTNALTSEHGDDSTEGADDLSSEFSDDVSVIEVQPEVSEATGNADGEDDDVIVDTDSLFYQSESEYREISLLNFDHRLLEPTTTRLLEPTTRLPVAAESSVPETDMSRMRACFYLPSIVADIEPKQATAGKSAGGSSSIEKLETRDFSQTAPWRLAKVIGGSRRPDDTAAAASGQQASTPSAAAERKTSEHPVSYNNNVIYIPISIFDKQLKLGSDYSFQRISQATSGDPDRPRSPPMSLTLMGRRIEERLLVANAENNNNNNNTNNLGGVLQHRSPADDVAMPTTAVTMTTARVYIAPMTSQSIPVAKGEAEVVPSSAVAPAVESRRGVSSDVLSELQDIPLPAVKDIVADLNSRLVKVAESYETSSGSGGGGGGQSSAELGTSFPRPETRRRRSSSGSDSDRETVLTGVEDPTPSKGLVRDHHHHHHRLDVPDQASTVYHSVVYRTRLSPKPSIRRFSLPGGSVTVRDSASSSSSSQRRVRFAEPPESSVIEIEARRVRVRDTDTDAAAAQSAASVSSLAKKLDRIELENALASAAMKRSRPFQTQVQVQAPDQVVSSLLASHPAQHPDTRTPPAPQPPPTTTAPKRGANHRGTTPATWKLDPIQERVIKIQTVQPSDLMRGDDGRQFRMASQQQQQQRGVAPLDSVQYSADFGGIFSLSIGPGSGGHLNLSLQQHPAAGNHGAVARSVYSPTKVNLVLPSSAAVAGAVGGEPGKFSYSVSTGGGGGRAPIKYTLPPSYEESMLAMASGRHPRSSSLDDARPAASPATALPSRVSELRTESHHHLVPGGFSTHHHQPPGLRIVRARSPTLSGASHHPGWVISTSHGAVQDHGPHHRDPRSYCQTLQVDTGSKQPQAAGRTQSGLPVYHARSGALSTEDAGSRDPVDPIFRIIAQPLAGRGGGKQGAAAGADLARPDVAARLVRGGSPLILASTGFSGSGPAKTPVQGVAGVHSFSPVSSPSGPDRRWPPTGGRIQDPHGPMHQGPSVYAAEAPTRPERRWPAAAAVAGLGPPSIAQHPPPQPASFPGEARRQGPPPTATARPFPDARGGGGGGGGGGGLPPPALQRMPGIFALLDKTFTDKVKQWEGSSRSGGLQQSETYKLVREMDDAMKQDKL